MVARKLARLDAMGSVSHGPFGVRERTRPEAASGAASDGAPVDVLRLDPSLYETPERRSQLVTAVHRWALLDEPGVVRLLAFEGATGPAAGPKGEERLVTESLDALSLTTLLLEGPLMLDAALLLVSEIARIVGAAHAAGDAEGEPLLHLGLCPEAVLVDARGQVAVRDFGLNAARIMPGWATDERLLELFRYTAPEVLAAEALDRRADVFSLGALLFHLVTGAPPFPGNTAVEVAAEVAAAPPSLDAVPASLGPLLARALAADPGARLPSLAELRAQTLALIGGRLLRARATLAARARQTLPREGEPEPDQSLTGSSPPTAVERVPAEIALPALPPPRATPVPASAPSTEERAPQQPLSATSSSRRFAAARTPSSGVWDPPSRTATVTLEELRRGRARSWLPVLVPLALGLTVVGVLYVLHRMRTRVDAVVTSDAPTAPIAGDAPKGAAAGGGKPVVTPLPTPGSLNTPLRSTPAGAQLYVDGQPRGETPTTLMLTEGDHLVVLVADGFQIWRQTIEAGSPVDAELKAISWPATLAGQAGLKVTCRTPNLWRVLVDGVDTGRTCPVVDRIPIQPGPHQITLYAPYGDRTLERPAHVKDRGASTRILIKE